MGENDIGGYRIVRKIGAGSRADVFLGAPRSHNSALEGHASHSGVALVALKVFRPATAADSIDTEVEALTRVEHPHVVKLRDLTTAPQGNPSLILERMSRGSLASLLDQRREISAGEAVTILAPIAAAVAAMHADGVLHGALRASAILFRESGAAVVTGFGHAELIGTGASVAALGAEPGVSRDYAALHRLARTVVEHIAGSRPEGFAHWLDSIPEDSHPDSFAEVLGERVFDLGAAEPVVFDNIGAVSHHEHALPARLMVPAPAPRRDIIPSRASPSDWSESSRGGLVTGVFQALRTHVPNLRAHLSDVRKPVWVVAALVAVSLVGAISLAGSPRAASESSPTPTQSPEPRSAIPGPANGADTANGADAEATAHSATVTGDDPVAALGDVLAVRNRCVRDLSILCLDDAVQNGSAAMDDDAQLIRSIQDGGQLPSAATIRSEHAELSERDGDAALITLDSAGVDAAAKNPIYAVLLVKGPNGWRIRDYLKS